jgi:replicative DNA helicase
MDVGGQLLLALVQAENSQEYQRYQLREDMFFGSELPIFNFIASHMAKHHQLPKLITLEENFPDLPKAPEPPLFYLDHVETRYTHKVLNRTLLDANALMKDQDSWTALTMVEETVHRLRMRELSKGITDFGHSELVLDEIRRVKLAGEDAGLMMGWPTVDKMSGGLRGGDIVSIIGRPAMGKTWFILFIAWFMWWLKQKNVLAVSMEMDVLSIAQRLMGIASGVRANHIRQADELTTVEMSRITKVAKGAKKHPSNLWLMDGNLNAQVDQIFTVVKQLKPAALFIDGAYLLGHPNERLDKYKRVDANVELIKRRAAECNVPVICSFQFNRDAVKKWKGKKDEGGGLEDIAHADAIGQISSIVLGMKQEDTVETAKQRVIDVLKCRTFTPTKFHVIPEKASQLKFV